MGSGQNKMRYHALDGLRGIAALLVAVFHFEVLTDIYDVPFVRNSYLFVDFFFVLSGFVLSHAYARRINDRQAGLRFAIHRFGRLWPLHAVLLLIFVTIEAAKLLPWLAGSALGAVPFDAQGVNPPDAIANHLLLTHALGIYDQLTWNGLSWSTSVEFWVSIIFVLVCLATRTARTPVLVTIGAGAAIWLIAKSSHGMDVTTDYGLARCLYGFVAGHLVWRMAPLFVSGGKTYGTIPEVLVIALVIGFVSLADRGPFSFAAPIAFALPVLVFSLERGGISRLLLTAPVQAIGRWSYSIYLVQGLVILVASLGISVIEGWSGTPIWQKLVQEGQTTRVVAGPPLLLDHMLLVYLGVLVSLSALSYRFIEQPGIRLFERISAATESTAAALTGVAPLPKTR